MESDATRSLLPEELTALRMLVDPHPGYAPILGTVAFLLRRQLVTLTQGGISLTQAGRNVLEGGDGRRVLH
jgi:hypothetical protein